MALFFITEYPYKKEAKRHFTPLRRGDCGIHFLPFHQKADTGQRSHFNRLIVFLVLSRTNKAIGEKGV